MKEQLTTFNTAKLAKKKGFWIKDSYRFDLKDKATICIGGTNIDKELKDIYFNKGVPGLGHTQKDLAIVVTQSLLQKWLREKHKININIGWVYGDNYKRADWYYNVKGINLHNNNLMPHNQHRFRTYEKALEEGLKQALKLI